MSIDFGAMNAALIGTLGEAATVQLQDGTSVGVTGVFHVPYLGADFNGQPIERLDTSFEVDARDWQAAGGDIGTGLAIRDRGYTVTDASTDEAGIARLVLRAYP